MMIEILVPGAKVIFGGGEQRIRATVLSTMLTGDDSGTDDGPAVSVTYKIGYFDRAGVRWYTQWLPRSELACGWLDGKDMEENSPMQLVRLAAGDGKGSASQA